MSNYMVINGKAVSVIVLEDHGDMWTVQVDSRIVFVDKKWVCKGVVEAAFTEEDNKGGGIW